MDAQTPHNKSDPVEAFISKWQGQEGGQERANYALFLTELCDVLDLPHPDVAKATHAHNDYVFERAVQRHLADGDSAGRIDLYKRNSFVLEAKQSRWKGGGKEIAGQNDLFSAESEPPFYDAAHILFKAIEKAGTIDDTTKIKEAMESIESYDGIQGKVRWGGKEAYGIAHQLLNPSFIGEIIDGKPTILQRVDIK